MGAEVDQHYTVRFRVRTLGWIQAFGKEEGGGCYCSFLSIKKKEIWSYIGNMMGVG